MGNSSFGLSIFFILHPLAFGALISAQYFRKSHREGSKARRNFHRKVTTLSHIIPIRFLAKQSPNLSGQIDRVGIASLQRTLPTMTHKTVLMQSRITALPYRPTGKPVSPQPTVCRLPSTSHVPGGEPSGIIASMNHIIAVDIGGTHLRAAAYPLSSLEPLQHYRIKTYQGKRTPQQNLLQAIRSVWPPQGSVLGIGVAVPGPVDPYQGWVLSTPNIPEWRNLPLAQWLSEQFQCPAWIENDANLAALGEWRYGAAQGHHDVLYLTISTGIGGGVIIADRLLRGAHGMAAELGHVTVWPEGPLCSCGLPGHLEAIASGPAIVRYVREQMSGGVSSSLAKAPLLSADQVAQAARQGDVLASQAFQRAGKYLGIALASFLHIFDPSIVVLGGGVSQSGDLLFQPMKEQLRQSVFHPRYLERLQIVTASLGDSAGLMGARALVEDQLHLQKNRPDP